MGKVFIWQEIERIDESGESKERVVSPGLLTRVLICLFMALKSAALQEKKREKNTKAPAASGSSVLTAENKEG